LTNRAVNLSEEIYGDINTIYDPSISKLRELSFKLEQSKILSNYWAYVESGINEEKQDLLQLIHTEIPQIQVELDSLSNSWDQEDRVSKGDIFDGLEDLMVQYTQVQELLPTLESYQDNSGFNWFMARDMAEEGGEIYEPVADISDRIDALTRSQVDKEGQALSEMVGSFQRLQFNSTFLGGLLMLVGLIIGMLTSRSIVNPLERLKGKLVEMGRGVLPPMEDQIARDEIGEVSVALNNMMQGQVRERTFGDALGRGDFTVDYDPLSVDDELAPDFLKTRESLAQNERITETKIRQRTQELEKKNLEINEQSERMRELYQDLMDSIEYAKRLQESILPTELYIEEHLPDSFVYFEPKDVVSGDFYWMRDKGDKVYIAAMDCTGHGVPGAFMSLVGHNSLNRAIEEAESGSAASLFAKLNQFATDALNRNTGKTTVRDGMDGSMCIYDKRTHKLQFTGAMNPLVYFSKGEMTRIKGDRVAIGSQDTRDHVFEEHEVQLEKGDTFYLFSDGYPDQFGGETEQGKKYMMSRFLRDLKGAQNMKMEAQHDMLKFNMMNWQQGKHAQVDDILIIGVKVV